MAKTYRNENDVKKRVKQILDAAGWFHWPNAAGPYSVAGIPDRMAIRDGRFLAIECKYGGNTPTTAQGQFLFRVALAGFETWVVNENNIEEFASEVA